MDEINIKEMQEIYENYIQNKLKDRIPVTILTGFLGSGKTTLLNWILTENHGKKIVVIENEYGEIGIDDIILKENKFNEEEVIIDMNNGCICCNIRGDLVKIMEKLIKRDEKYDHIIIETTGLADPSPICKTFLLNHEISLYAKIDAVITMVDSKYILQHLNEKRDDDKINESIQQLAFADRIILNKIDLVESSKLTNIKNIISSINNFADVIPTSLKNNKIPLDLILGIDSFNLEKISKDKDFFNKHKHKHTHTHTHTHTHKHTHNYHDSSIGSVSIEVKGDINIDRLENFIEELLNEKSNDLYRYKGILSIENRDEKYIFQGIHELFDGEFMSQWKNEERINKIIFIGRNLDKNILIKNFKKCINI